MKTKYACAVGLAVLLAAAPAAAAPWDYTFQVVQPPTAVDGQTIATIRLLHLPSGRIITDAAVSARWLVQAPYKSAAPHDEKRVALSPDGRGSFRYVEPAGRGTRSLYLIATVPGEFWVIGGRVQLMPAR